MITGGNEDVKKVILIKPISLDGNFDAFYQPPNIGRRILTILKDLRPGSDLTNFQLSAMFNYPKSQLQGFGEAAYAVRENMLKKCNNGENAIERMIRVVAWTISTTRPVIFGISPYNPILGETHHISKGSLNLLLEQVEHHPPVHALHGTDEIENIELLWCQNIFAKFHGTYVEAGFKGERKLKLHNHGETYVMNTPKLIVKFIPPKNDWVGNVKIQCQETGLEADLCYSASSFFRKKEANSIKGRIYYSSSSNTTLFEVYGQWTSIVTVKDVNNGKESVIYNAKEALSGLKAPIVRDLQGIKESESALLWSEVSEGIMSKNWERATKAKRWIEEKEREKKRDRNSKGETWVPKHFNVSCSKDGVWSCSPILELVPPAPLIVPF